jgi:hypothetical protein
MEIKAINLNKYNNIKKHISFKENNNVDTRDNTAVLSLQGPDSLVNFQKDFRIAKEADAVQSNPFKALFVKLYKVFKSFFGKNKNVNPDVEVALCTYA